MNRISLEFVEDLEFARLIIKNFMSNLPTSTIKELIIKTRDFFKLPIKFKPWESTKLAGKISNLLKEIGLLIETLSIIGRIVSKLKFEEKEMSLLKT